MPEQRHAPNMSVLERTILSARWVVGQTGFIAATIAYLQAISSDEARELAATDEQLGYAIGAHQTLYAHNLTIQIASILDNGRRTIALREVEALQRAKPVALDEVFRYAASQHRDVGIELSRERFDRNVALVATMAKELRKTSHYVSVEKFRNGGVAHLTLQDYRVSFAEMAETAHELFQISGALQFLFKGAVDERDFIDLYQCHLGSATKLYRLTRPLEPMFTRTTLEFRVRPRRAPDELN